MVSEMTVTQAIVMVFCVVILILGVIFLTKIVFLSESILTKALPDTHKLNIVAVNPSNSQAGTLFFITAIDSEQREQQDLSLIINKSNSVDWVTLYDDGKHYDENPKDGIYGGFFNSTNKPPGKYDIVDNDKILTSFEISDSRCENIYGNGKIKFMILPQDYDDYLEFKEDAKKMILDKNSLLTIEPFASNKDKFSFFIANSLIDLGCTIGCKNVSTIVCCDNDIVLKEASKCDYDHIFVLVKSEKECGSASSYAKICSKHPDANLFLLHELGHSFGDLADEYVYSDFFGEYSIGEINDVNCAERGCEKWKNITKNCYPGCTYSNLFRSADTNSIMYDLYPQFNEICKNHLKALIDNYILRQREVEKASPKKRSYFININYDDGKLKIKNIFLKPIRSEIGYKSSDYRIEIKDRENNKLFNSSLYLPDKLYPLPNSGNIIFEKKFDFSFTLPYYSKADNLIVYKKEKPLASISLTPFSETCGNKICDGSENHQICPVDCDIRDNFCETTFCDPDCESQKNCSNSKKIKFILPIALISISGIIILLTLIKIKKQNKN